ncbi:hypothetical protein R5A26_18710 [Streptomyces prunicolor]|uniref:Uncharacterized protein n=1 Tax=Streptomyces prunicolor TaxID=67348 RepID=A0ABU4FBK2_9ACTN|nr:hypothetical protein [Streptomyces prunicolor]MDV7217983.1 hypothetical protein [Streptomyces prunicolor]
MSSTETRTAWAAASADRSWTLNFRDAATPLRIASSCESASAPRRNARAWPASAAVAASPLSVLSMPKRFSAEDTASE